jgi:hypothetical protein
MGRLGRNNGPPGVGALAERVEIGILVIDGQRSCDLEGELKSGPPNVMRAANDQL